MCDVSLFYIKSYIGIHSKIQAYFFGQDIKKNKVRNYRTDMYVVTRDEQIRQLNTKGTTNNNKRYYRDTFGVP